MTKQENLIETAEILLESMGIINYLTIDKKVILQKDRITFGKIENDTIYLITNTGKFQPVEPTILEIQDQFLKLATTAYWSAKTITKKDLQQTIN